LNNSKLSNKLNLTGLFIGKGSPMTLTNGKRYKIIGEDFLDTYRVIDETGEDYLYSKRNFTDIRGEENNNGGK